MAASIAGTTALDLLSQPAARADGCLGPAPGVQLYTGSFLDGSLTGHGGARYGRFHGVCLETQAFPDAPNQPGFPSARLEPGEEYAHTTLYRVSQARP